MLSYVLEWVDALGSLLDLTTNDFRNELGGKLSESTGRGLALDDLGHFLANGSNLRGSSVCGLLDLIWTALGEGDGEEAEKVVVGSLDGNICLNERLPLPDE